MSRPIPSRESRLELLVWSECPSHEEAERMLRAALVEAGHADETYAVRWIESHDDAEAERFAGSPTFRIDGVDLVDPGEWFGLMCRVYQSDGHPSPLPSQTDLTEWVREGLN